MGKRITWGEQLRRWRAKQHQGAGVNQTECAKAVGVAQAEWSAWERGVYFPSTVSGFRVQKLTGISFEQAAAEKAKRYGGKKKRKKKPRP